ncbi:DUF1178 family protein [Cognatishimia sp. MH4019]|uniref:DUF1178 family protein n=1 Tax=Cognatishimia sp. MH4019 TaxID=2854030 RepID=UPI001CD36912|nr:DUF1178 family protein [Cognatishimia sp. MH4019]
MIRFALKCDKDHRFESWFASGEAFETLKAQGHVACAICGSTGVEKDIMAPRVSAARDDDAPLSAPASPAEQAVAEMRKHVEENADYVGKSFAKEAREIHDGSAPDRAIYGEANAKEARALIEDGVPVVPLPFNPNRKTN